MRKILLVLFLISLRVLDLSGQVRGEAYLPSFFVDIDAGEGILNQQAKFTPIQLNYPQIVNPYVGNLRFKSGTSSLADIQFGYYINRKRTWGIGIGFMFNKQSSTLGLDTFHVEYKSTDDSGKAYRQLVSTNHPIAESINMYSINIPILLRYKKDFSSRFGLTVDGGIVYNTQLQNTWSTNANFKYEAVYDFIGNSPNTVYDNGIATSTEFPITVNAFLKDNNQNGGNIANYFAIRSTLYNVGLSESPTNSSGSFKLATGTLGYTLDAALNFRITGKVYFKLGAYYLSQTFNNTSTNNSLPLTENIIRNSAGQVIGVDYNSLINAAKSIQSTSYGITAGIRIYLSRNSVLDFN